MLGSLTLCLHGFYAEPLDSVVAIFHLKLSGYNLLLCDVILETE